MIDKFDRHEYTLTCDICGNDSPHTFDDFYEAVDYKKNNGWVSRKDDYDWYDVCPDCQNDWSD